MTVLVTHLVNTWYFVSPLFEPPVGPWSLCRLAFNFWFAETLFFVGAK